MLVAMTSAEPTIARAASGCNHAKKAVELPMRTVHPADPSLVYYGTDTRIGGLMLGCCLALFWHPRQLQAGIPPVKPRAVAAAGILGLALIALGLLLSGPGIPGQGLLTIVIGLILLDYPGKRKLERRLAARPVVLRAINRVRTRFRRPPMKL